MPLQNGIKIKRMNKIPKTYKDIPKKWAGIPQECKDLYLKNNGKEKKDMGDS